jgi:putative CocE/NonD family hydrolase
MRDGVKLFTIVYTPKNKSEEYPILLMRTPYNVSLFSGNETGRIFVPSKSFIQEGYIFVFQDVRGKFMSEGEFVNMRPYNPNKITDNDIDESSDTYDTIEWLINNIENHNSKVGLWGNSYPGFFTIMGSIDAHPNLVAVSPQAPIADWFIGDDFHHNGAFSLLMAFNFFKTFGIPRVVPTTKWPESINYPSPDAYTFFLNLGPLKNVNRNYFEKQIPFWDSLMKHGTYNYFWQSRNVLPHLNNIRPAVLTVGGWYDSEDLYGPLNIYKSIETNDSLLKNTIVMGPWTHGHWIEDKGDSLNDFYFGSNTADYFRQNILEPFFRYHLKGEANPNLKSAYMFDTGKNEWNYFDHWPSDKTFTKEFFFDGSGTLSINSTPDHSEYTEFLSDPYNPVPYTDMFIDSRRFYRRQYMIEDQRFTFTRPDVISFQTEPLEENITIAGPITADLFVSTTGTDADWVVKLIDVYPYYSDNPDPNPAEIEMGGYQRLVRYEIMRGKFRNSIEYPEPFIPDRITNVKFNLNDAYHTFKKGHRIMVQIQSSMFPFYDRNPQTFTDIYNADEKDFIKSYHRVYHNKNNQSRITLNLLNQ